MISEETIAMICTVVMYIAYSIYKSRNHGAEQNELRIFMNDAGTMLRTLSMSAMNSMDDTPGNSEVVTV